VHNFPQTLQVSLLSRVKWYWSPKHCSSVKLYKNRPLLLRVKRAPDITHCQDSVATRLTFGEVFNGKFTTNLQSSCMHRERVWKIDHAAFGKVTNKKCSGLSVYRQLTAFLW